MKDCLKILASGFVSEYALPQNPAVRSPIFMENTRPEAFADGCPHQVVSSQEFVSAQIRIEVFSQ